MVVTQHQPNYDEEQIVATVHHNDDDNNNMNSGCFSSSKNNDNNVHQGNGVVDDTTTAATTTIIPTNMIATSTTGISNDIHGTNKKNSSMNSNNKKKKMNPKRQRFELDEPPLSSGEDQQEQQQEYIVYQLLNDYYQRLVYQCHKDFNKHIKLTKNFLLQKQIRLVKDMTTNAIVTKKKKKVEEEVERKDVTTMNCINNSANINNESVDATNTPMDNSRNTNILINKQKMKLQQMKDCFKNHPHHHKTINVINEMVIQECDRRLGLLQLDPKLVLLPPSQSTLSPPNVNKLKTSIKLNDDDDDDDDDDDSKGDDSNDGGSVELDNQNIDKCVGSDNDIDGNSSVGDRNDSRKTTITTTATVPPLTGDNVPPDAVVTTTTTTAADSMENTQRMLIQRILQHKTITTALEHWHNEVTQYRIWSMQQQERFYNTNNNKYNPTSTTTTNNIKGGRSSKKTKRSNVTGPLPLDRNNSIFVSLGDAHSDNDDDGDIDDDNPYSHYGPAAGQNGNTMKKNRQGQRGRRAKMAAIQAKKLGHSIPKEESINWRRGGNGGGKSDHHTNINNPYNSSSTSGGGGGGGHPNRKSNNSHSKSAAVSSSLDAVRRPASHITNHTDATTTTNVTLHPSWQAKKESKATIVAFQGTKITFD